MENIVVSVETVTFDSGTSRAPSPTKPQDALTKIKLYFHAIRWAYAGINRIFAILYAGEMVVF